MRRYVCAVLFLVFGATLPSCSSGGGAPTCSLHDPGKLATTSPWPKFRANLANTGTVENPAVANLTGQMRWVFPPLDQPAKGAFVASPVISSNGDTLYIGSNDTTVYALRLASDGANAAGTQTSFNLTVAEPITSTALVGTRDGQDAVFVASNDGHIYAVLADGTVQASHWPYPFSSFLAASPTISATDGTIYMGGQNGLFVGVCPNGVGRFSVPSGSVQSSAAVDADAILYYGADDRNLRAVRYDGLFMWSFATAGSILTAPVLDEESGQTVIYVADRGGHVFKVDSTGRPVSSFTSPQVGPISSSPALADGRLYVGSDDGNLYALDSTTGAMVWSYHSGDAIQSSPAVATGGAEPIIAVGSNDGNLHVVADLGAQPMLVALVSIGAPVRSSPAIGSDGTLYVGADDGRVYAIQ